MPEHRSLDGPLSVFLIEEDTRVSMLVTSALKAEGYLFIGSATSVGEAKRVVDEEQPDIILMDHRILSLDEFNLEASRVGIAMPIKTSAMS